jgi:hypothetical protein
MLRPIEASTEVAIRISAAQAGNSHAFPDTTATPREPRGHDPTRGRRGGTLKRRLELGRRIGRNLRTNRQLAADSRAEQSLRPRHGYFKLHCNMPQWIAFGLGAKGP